MKLCVTLIISLVTLQVLKCILSISISTQRNFVPNALSQQVSFWSHFQTNVEKSFVEELKGPFVAASSSPGLISYVNILW